MSTLNQGRRSTITEQLPVRDGGGRPFTLDQQIRYSYSRPITHLRQQLRVVPPARHGGQRRSQWSLTVAGVESWNTTESVDSYGNLVLSVNVPRVEEAIELVVHVEALTTHAPALTAPTAADPRYLHPTPLTSADESVTDLLRSSSGAGGESANVESICDRVHRSIDYRWGITGVHTTASEALAGGLGVCQDYAHIMLAACRRAGLAARYVSGHLIGEGGSHAWVEVLHRHSADRRDWWVEAWDPTHNRRVDDSYLVVAVGRDYRDAAPMSGTFTGVGVTGRLEVHKRLTA